MNRKMLFTRYGGTPQIVYSIEDIIRNLGELMQGFDNIEIDQGRVLARKGIDYIVIGTIQYC